MTQLAVGDPAPWFVAPASCNAAFTFDVAAGRYLVLCFFRSAGTEPVRAMLHTLWQQRAVFDDLHCAFFGVSCDPDDFRLRRVVQQIPGFRLFWDFDYALSVRYGVCRSQQAGRYGEFDAVSLVIDPRLRVLAVLPIADPARHAAELARFVSTLPDITAGDPLGPAPVLAIPRVLEPGLCRELVALYERKGGQDSGFMLTDPATGKTVSAIDYTHKRRRDFVIDDPALVLAIRNRVERRIVPELQKAFQFAATRLERYIVSCYDAGEGGYFHRHRDNTTKGTAHRRFAITINLNVGEYAGGELCFPEFGLRRYRAETGGAIVFSCSLLHEALPVTQGRRYCVLPFLYDEAAAQIRQANLEHLADERLRENVRATMGAVEPQSNGKTEDGR